MELKEYLAIFRKNFRIFAAIIVVFLLAGVFFPLLQPLEFKSSLTLNVTRKGAQQTGDYKYDGFYRLQADERFADTVVRWLGSPKIAAGILENAGINTSDWTLKRLTRYFQVQRLSSQIINVTYVTADSELAKKTAKAIIESINRNSEELNKLQQEESWFLVIGENPIIRENKINWIFSGLIFLCAGIFIGTWVVFLKHYLE